MDQEVEAYQKSKYYFQSNADYSTTFDSYFVGEMDEDYEFTDSIAIEDLVWSPCGRSRALNIETQIRVDASYADSDASGLITVDPIDGELTHIYGIKWQRCT